MFGDIADRVDPLVYKRLEHAVGLLSKRAEEIESSKKSKAEKKKELLALNTRCCMQKLLRVSLEPLQRAMPQTNQGQLTALCTTSSASLRRLLGQEILSWRRGGTLAYRFPPNGACDCNMARMGISVLGPDLPGVQSQGWRTNCLTVAARDVEVRVNRPRNFSWTARFQKLRMKAALSQQILPSVCSSPVTCTGHDFLFMNPRDAADWLEGQVKKVLTGKKGFRKYLTEGALGRLGDYERLYMQKLSEGEIVDLPIVDLSQNVSYRGLSSFVPSLLCQSLMWSFKHERPMTAPELSC